jgi:hydrazine synthase alpha subunit-like protein
VGGYDRLGQLQCMNVYETDQPDVAAVPVGAVKSVRLVEGLPMTRAEAKRAGLSAPEGEQRDAWPPPFVRTRALGVAPVEADGSFYVNVAGNTPFYIETLDAGGEVLSVMRAWTWVRNRSQRGCIGCHEDKELAPENRATEALIRADPLNLMGPRTPVGAEE